MKKLIIVGLTSLVLFGISGVASYMIQQHNSGESGHGSKGGHGAGKKETGHGNSGGHAASGHGTGGHSSSGQASHGGESSKGGRLVDEPVTSAVRPPFAPPSAEELLKLAKELELRRNAIKETEKIIAKKQREQDLVRNDMQSERNVLDDLQKQVQKELEAVKAALTDLEQRSTAIKSEMGKAKAEADAIEKGKIKSTGEEQEALKKLAGVWNTMAPEAAAKTIRSMVDSGKMDTAVKLLVMMQEKKVAIILPELNDPALAAQLIQKMKDYSKPTTPPLFR